MEKEIVEEKTKEIEETLRQWKERLKQGGQDPFYADGGGLNTLRGRIKRGLEELEKENGEAATSSLRIPPEMPDEYMARARDIWYGGLKSYVAYKEDENYQYLCQVKESLPKDIRKRSCIDNVIGYVQVIEHALKEKDFITARRHEHAERYQSSFLECRNRIGVAMQKEEAEREHTQAENVQMDLLHMGIHDDVRRK